MIRTSPAPLRHVLLLVLWALAIWRPAVAADPAAAASSFSPEQRREIVGILRDALKSDSSILRDAVVALQADDQAHAAADLKHMIAQKRRDLLANAADPVAGNPSGDVTLVEFYDPRCPYCRRMMPAITAMLQKDHGVRIVYKDIPILGPASVMESRAILAAQRQGGYSRMQDALMRDPSQPSASMLADTARGLGLNPAKLAVDMQSQAVTQQLAAAMALARDLKLDGTPVFLVGDSVIQGAVDQAQLEAAIAGARKHG